MTDPLLTIQIPTYRNPKQLSDTLSSLLTHTEYPYTIRVINNDTYTEAVDEIVEGLGVDCVEVIHAGGNTGWMGAHNLALKECDTPFVCFLNDDVVFLPYQRNFWRKLIQQFKYPAVGAVGPSSNFVMGSQNLWQIRLPIWFDTTLLIGFCVVMRTDLIKDLGGMDETLPGGDDLDWSIRIREAGYRLIVDRSAYLHHIGQQTGRRVHADWDGVVHQENTINALVRKHGVKLWYECFTAQVLSQATIEEKSDEDLWLDGIGKTVEDKTGFNLGSGARDNAGFGLDLARPGEQGAGGRKFEGATPEIVGNALEIPVADESLDYVMANHLLEHLVHPLDALREWSRTLKPEGILYLTCPDHEQVDTMLIDYTHVHAYTRKGLCDLLEVAGWNVEGCVLFSTGSFGVSANRRNA